MKKKIDEQAEDWKSKYLRALADYQNLERRHREEKVDVHNYANGILIVRFLSAIDTLKLAKHHIQDKGLELAYNEFIAILAEQGVEEIQTVGLAFNPHEMECIEAVDGKEGIVVEELQSGYRLNGKILRVAKVKVGKIKEDICQK